MDVDERRKVANQVLELVGLENWGTRYPHELSGGMQQRVGLGRPAVGRSQRWNGEWRWMVLPREGTFDYVGTVPAGDLPWGQSPGRRSLPPAGRTRVGPDLPEAWG